MSKIPLIAITGQDDVHDGACCDCCAGYCPRTEYPAEDAIPTDGCHRPVRATLHGHEWVGSTYFILRSDLVEVPDDADVLAITLARSKSFGSRITGPATGLVGVETLEVLHRVPALNLADSDVDGQFAITLDGEFVGLTTKVRPGSVGLALADLNQARALAKWAGGNTDESPAMFALLVLEAFKAVQA